MKWDDFLIFRFLTQNVNVEISRWNLPRNNMIMLILAPFVEVKQDGATNLSYANKYLMKNEETTSFEDLIGHKGSQNYNYQK